MTPEISIIIPVYNVQKYIIECLDSLRAQSDGNYEAILVNDGSTDNSGQIIDDYIAKHKLSNFRVINKENGGLSSARNAGLAAATGKWVLFFDSDDRLEPDCLQELLRVANQSRADLIIGGYQAYDQSTGQTEVWSNYPCDGGTIPQDMHNLHSFSFCWGRLYKKSIIDQNGIRFDERLKYAEDNAWQFDYIQNIDSFAYSHKVIYNYRINTAEQSTSKLITPMMKRHRFEHLQRFLAHFNELDIADILMKNPRLLSVVWGILTDAAIIDVLDKNRKAAKAKIHSPLSAAVIAAFVPRSKKERFFLFLWKRSFLLLTLFVNVYYGNFERLRKSRLLKAISKRK